MIDLTDLRPGVRVRLIREVDRYPFFVAPEGLTGTVAEHTDVGTTQALLSVRMDATLDDCEEWDNCIQWNDDAYEWATADLELLA